MEKIYKFLFKLGLREFPVSYKTAYNKLSEDVKVILTELDETIEERHKLAKKVKSLENIIKKLKSPTEAKKKTTK
jgi:hypothetical protein